MNDCIHMSPPQLVFCNFFRLWEYVCVTSCGMSHHILNGEQVTHSFTVSLLKGSPFLFHSSLVVFLIFPLFSAFDYILLLSSAGQIWLPVWGLGWGGGGSLSESDSHWVNLMLTGHQKDLFVRRLSCCLRLSVPAGLRCDSNLWLMAPCILK